MFSFVIYLKKSASSQDLADHFDKKNLMSAFGFCLIAFTIISISFHNKILVNNTHNFRVITVVNILTKSIIYFFSFLSIGIANLTDNINGFYLALFGSTI